MHADNEEIKYRILVINVEKGIPTLDMPFQRSFVPHGYTRRNPLPSRSPTIRIGSHIEVKPPRRTIKTNRSGQNQKSPSPKTNFVVPQASLRPIFTTENSSISIKKNKEPMQASAPRKNFRFLKLMFFTVYYFFIIILFYLTTLYSRCHRPLILLPAVPCQSLFPIPHEALFSEAALSLPHS